MRTIGVIAALTLLFVPYAPVQWASAFVLLVFGASLAYARTLRTGVEITRPTETIRMFRHEDAEVRLVVTNHGFLPVPMLLVSDSTGELYTRDDSAFVLSIPARGRRVLRYRLRAHYRGVYPLGPVRTRTADPLGLFPLVREIAVPGRVIVYPRHQHLDLPRKLGVPVGAVRVETPLAADTTRYRSLRDYVAGDDTRHIGWKATARHGSLKTREFTPTIEAPLCIFLNLRAEDFADRHMVLAVERSVETAASLVMAAVRSRRSFRLIAHADLPAGGLAGDPSGAAGGGGPGGGGDATSGGDTSAPPGRDEIRGAGEPAALAALELLAGAAALYNGPSAGEALAARLSGRQAERVCYVGPALADAQIGLLLGAGVRPGNLELYYVQELTRRAVVRNPHGLSVHTMRLFGDTDGDAKA